MRSHANTGGDAAASPAVEAASSVEEPGATEAANGNEPPDCCDDSCWIKHDVGVEHPKGDIPEGGGDPITLAISNLILPARMVGKAVGFHDHAALYNRVDSANPSDTDLDFTAKARAANYVSQNAFLSGVHAGVDPGAQYLAADGYVGEDLVEIACANHTLVERRIHSGESEWLLLALNDLHEGIPGTNAVFGSIGTINQRGPM